MQENAQRTQFRKRKQRVLIGLAFFVFITFLFFVEGQQGFIKVLQNTDECLGTCSTIIEVKNPNPILFLFNMNSFLFEFSENKTPFSKLELFIWEESGYDRTFSENMGKVCYPYFHEGNQSMTQNCTSHYIQRTVFMNTSGFVPLTTIQRGVNKGKPVRIKMVTTRQPSLNFAEAKWGVTFNNQFIDPWFNTSWLRCKDVALVELRHTNRNYVPIRINVTDISQVQDDGDDIRITNRACNDGGVELDRDIIENGSDFAEIFFMANTTDSVNYSVYYDNSAVAAPVYTGLTNTTSGSSEIISNPFYEMTVAMTFGYISLLNHTAGDNRQMLGPYGSNGQEGTAGLSGSGGIIFDSFVASNALVDCNFEHQGTELMVINCTSNDSVSGQNFIIYDAPFFDVNLTDLDFSDTPFTKHLLRAISFNGTGNVNVTNNRVVYNNSNNVIEVNFTTFGVGEGTQVSLIAQGIVAAFSINESLNDTFLVMWNETIAPNMSKEWLDFTFSNSSVQLNLGGLNRSNSSEGFMTRFTLLNGTDLDLANFDWSDFESHYYDFIDTPTIFVSSSVIEVGVEYLSNVVVPSLPTMKEDNFTLSFELNNSVTVLNITNLEVNIIQPNGTILVDNQNATCVVLGNVSHQLCNLTTNFYKDIKALNASWSYNATAYTDNGSVSSTLSTVDFDMDLPLTIVVDTPVAGSTSGTKAINFSITVGGGDFCDPTCFDICTYNVTRGAVIETVTTSYTCNTAFIDTMSTDLTTYDLLVFVNDTSGNGNGTSILFTVDTVSGGGSGGTGNGGGGGGGSVRIGTGSTGNCDIGLSGRITLTKDKPLGLLEITNNQDQAISTLISLQTDGLQPDGTPYLSFPSQDLKPILPGSTLPVSLELNVDKLQEDNITENLFAQIKIPGGVNNCADFVPITIKIIPGIDFPNILRDAITGLFKPPKLYVILAFFAISIGMVIGVDRFRKLGIVRQAGFVFLVTFMGTFAVFIFIGLFTV